jgi:prepilin-type N-terminal cleavage/methylation domain-containing protein
MFSKKLHRKKNRGFTLIETIVAIMVLTFAVTGPLVLASRSLHASVDARNRLIATHLGEQSIEVIRAIRDNNSSDDLTADRSKWMQDILPGCANKCVIDQTQVLNGKFTAAAIIPCPGGNCGTRDRVYLNPNTGMYAQSQNSLGAPWVLTGFRGSILVTGVDNPGNPKRQVRLTATFTYVGGGSGARPVVLVDDLYNWFPALHN